MERFESKPIEFVSVATPTTVYVGIAKREDFDRIAAPCTDHGENDNGHVLTKKVGGFGADEVTVVFQHWIKQRTLEAWVADTEAQRAVQLTADHSAGDKIGGPSGATGSTNRKVDTRGNTIH
jgi:hypothetical protein